MLCRSYGSKHPSDRGTWSGEASRNRGYGFTENEVTINIHGDNETVETKQKPQKERPVWLTESTLEAAAASATVLQQVCWFQTRGQLHWNCTPVPELEFCF